MKNSGTIPTFNSPSFIATSLSTEFSVMTKSHNLSSQTSIIKVHLQGKFKITTQSGLDITPSSTKARCILIMLALSEEGSASRDSVAQLLWGRHVKEQARTSLRQSLSLLRRTFQEIDPDLIQANRDKINLNLKKVDFDYHELIHGFKRQPSANRIAQLRSQTLFEEAKSADVEFDNWLELKKKHLLQKIDQEVQSQLPPTLAESPINTGTHPIRSKNNSNAFRLSLLTKMNTFWIGSVLENALFNKVTIPLVLHEKTDLIYHPWQNIIQQTTPLTTVYHSTQILQAFNQHQQKLLIVGPAGSGKTTLMLTLGKALLNLAKQDDILAVPVVLHLSTFNKDDSSLRQWLERELEYRYQIPKKIAAEMIANQELLLLLDGLDEVAPNRQQTCVRAINQWIQQEPDTALAVCCREEDYKKLEKKLALSGALSIQVLSHQQIKNYVEAVTGHSSGLKDILSKAGLEATLNTPLMLNIAAVVYQNENQTTSETGVHSSELTQKQLISSYVGAMFQRRTKVSRYSEQQTHHWLSCLAHAMRKKQQSILYLDRIQPDLLEKRSQRLLVSRGSVMICALSIAMILAMPGGLLSNVDFNHTIAMFIAALVGGYLAGRLGYGDEIKAFSEVRLSKRGFRTQTMKQVIGSSILAGTLAVGAAFILNLLTGIVLGGVFFLLLIIVNSLEFGVEEGDSIEIDAPNRGIKQALKYALISFSLVGIISASISLLMTGIVESLVIGLLLGVLCGLFMGGHTCIQHYLLRLLLWRNKFAPLNYVPFLEFAVDRVLLYRVGRGYLFAHRSLMDFYAEQYEEMNREKN